MPTKAQEPEAQCRLLTCKAVAEFCSFSVRKIYALVASGELRSYKIGQSRRILSSDLMDWLVEHAEGGLLPADEEGLQ